MAAVEVVGGGDPDSCSTVVAVAFTRLGGAKEEMMVNLSMKCSDFVNFIADRFELDATKIKLVCSGKMLKHSSDKSLAEMRVKRGAKIILMNKPKIKPMAMATTSSSSTAPVSTIEASPTSAMDVVMSKSADSSKTGVSSLEPLKKLEEIRKAAELLAKRSDDGFEWHSQAYMEITNQSGDVVHIDEASRKALTTGMVLHSKAKKYMKLKNYEMAAMLCELAFESFSHSEKKWLDITDNFGMLALDRVWLFFLKKDDAQLLEAAKWLVIADSALQKAHGRHLERLKAFRGDGFMPELVMYVRLDILRGMNCLMKGDSAQAQAYCDRARMNLRHLEVNTEDFVTLLSMDFTEKEARRGLRACKSNRAEAVEYILRMREERVEKRRVEIARRRDRRRARLYGLTQSGKFVDLKLLDAIIGMGVDSEVAVEVLRQVDNHYEKAMDLVLDPSRKQLVVDTLLDRGMAVAYALVQEMAAMGYTEARVRAALLLRNGHRDAAIDMLTSDELRTVQQLSRVEMQLLPLVVTRAIKRDAESAKYSAALAAMDTDTDADMATMASAADLELEAAAVGSGAADDGVVEPVSLDAAAFPNPALGDTVPSAADGAPGDGQWADDQMAKSFDKVKTRRASEKRIEDETIEKEILGDFEEEDGFDDAHAYLDIELDEEQAAVDQLSVLLISMRP